MPVLPGIPQRSWVISARRRPANPRQRRLGTHFVRQNRDKPDGSRTARVQSQRRVLPGRPERHNLPLSHARHGRTIAVCRVARMKSAVSTARWQPGAVSPRAWQPGLGCLSGCGGLSEAILTTAGRPAKRSPMGIAWQAFAVRRLTSRSAFRWPTPCQAAWARASTAFQTTSHWMPSVARYGSPDHGGTPICWSGGGARMAGGRAWWITGTELGAAGQ